MKQLLSFVGLSLMMSFVVAQPTLDWVKQTTGNNFVQPRDLAFDAAGNIYVIGGFQGTADFDPGPGTATYTAGSTVKDIYIQKLDPLGNFLWAKRIGAAQADEGFSIVIDALGNIYAAGSFSGTVDFDPGAAVYNMTSGGGKDIFIEKLDAGGNFVWAKRVGEGADDVAYALALNSAGNPFVTGYFQGTVDFDPGVGVSNLTATIWDLFILQLDASGNMVWAKHLSSSGLDVCSAIKIDGSDNIYLTGWFVGTIDSDPGVGVSNLTAAGQIDVLVEKLDTAGNFVWARAMGGSGSDLGYDLAVDDSGNVFLAGSFEGTADFDPGTGSFLQTAPGIWKDIFIEKLDATGNFVWAHGFGDSLTQDAYSINLDENGNLYATGDMQGTVDFDPGVNVQNQSAGNLIRTFILVLSNAGNHLWSTSISGSSSSYGDVIAVDGNYSVFTLGHFQGTSDFDPGPGTLNMTTGVGNVNDGYIQKLGQCIPASISGMGNALCTSSGAVTLAGFPAGGTFSGPGVIGNQFTPSAAGLGMHTITYTATTGCTSVDTQIVTVTSPPMQPYQILGDTNLCDSATATYFAIIDTMTTSLTWTLPNGWSGTSITDIIVATAGAMGGTISVIANNSCGSSAAQTLNVTVTTIPPQPGSITGNTSPCNGSINTYSVPNDPNATSYSWTLPGAWTGSSTTNAIIATTGPNGGTFTVAANNACGTSSPQLLNVSLGPITIANWSAVVNWVTVDFTDLSTEFPIAWAWDFGDGNTSNLQNPTHIYNSTAFLTVCLIATNACGSDTFCNYLDVSTGIESRFPEFSFLISPNPADGPWTLNAQGLADVNTTMRITDVIGKVIMESELLPQSGELIAGINSAGLPAGTYFVMLCQSGQFAVRKLVVR